MVCGKRLQRCPDERTSSSPARARRIGTVLRPRAAGRIERTGADAERALDHEAAVVAVARHQGHEVGPQEALGPRQGAVDGLAVGQGGVDLLADVADLHELAVVGAQARQVAPAFGGLGGLAHLQHLDEVAEQLADLRDLVLGPSDLALAPEPLARLRQQAVEGPEDEPDEGAGDQRRRRRRPRGRTGRRSGGRRRARRRASPARGRRRAAPPSAARGWYACACEADRSLERPRQGGCHCCRDYRHWRRKREAEKGRAICVTGVGHRQGVVRTGGSSRAGRECAGGWRGAPAGDDPA